MALNDLETTLRKTFEDFRLDAEEKNFLRELSSEISDDQRRFLRNKAFDFAREAINRDTALSIKAINWLERVIKSLDSNSSSHQGASAHFSPGDSCRRAIMDCCKRARKSIDICVFTISDDRLTEAILAAHARGTVVRIITDNDKSNDRGSDIDRLAEEGVSVRMDRSSNHMHHKFAVFDGDTLINGSFNWTRSASRYNEENIVVSQDPNLIRSFSEAFDVLWDKFG